MILGDVCTRACEFCVVKTGLPGMAWVRVNPQADWPEELQVRLPQ